MFPVTAKVKLSMLLRSAKESGTGVDLTDRESAVTFPDVPPAQVTPA